MGASRTKPEFPSVRNALIFILSAVKGIITAVPSFTAMGN